MAAVTQIRYRHTKGRAYYQKKLAQGNTSKGTLRRQRQVSDAIYQHLKADARRAAATAGPEGTRRTILSPARPGAHPADRLFSEATPGHLPPPYDPRPATSEHGQELAVPRRTRRPAPAQTSANPAPHAPRRRGVGRAPPGQGRRDRPIFDSASIRAASGP